MIMPLKRHTMNLLMLNFFPVKNFMGKLQHKVAIISDSGEGIGKEIARKYAQEGAKVVIADFNESTYKGC
ncbi:short-chain dehydrogenase/reductase SDR [Lysinibacillus sphaericus OT4b.31]|uniref:Short-chain dehydrogenase/reductase SDR n=1 Tax=Lysinibacillus sphaericus OT4b.31 TaxID=1285586 RepID=R7ZI31_LYSSH|nr:short-chain dehydrogenase/reductase SDR [Lysinibacillus sphaericus OT4b.31]